MTNKNFRKYGYYLDQQKKREEAAKKAKEDAKRWHPKKKEREPDQGADRAQDRDRRRKVDQGVDDFAQGGARQDSEGNFILEQVDLVRDFFRNLPDSEIAATRDRLRSIFRPQEAQSGNVEPMADIVRIVKAHSLTAEIVREMYQALMIDVPPAPKSPGPRSVSPTPDADTRFRGRDDHPTGVTLQERAVGEDEPAGEEEDANENVAGVTVVSDRRRMTDESDHRQRNPEIMWHLQHSACTGPAWIDIDPTELATEVLENIFRTREAEKTKGKGARRFRRTS